MYSTDNNNVQYNNVQYTCNNKNKSLLLFFILNRYQNIPFTSNGRLAASVTGGPGDPVRPVANPEGGGFVILERQVTTHCRHPNRLWAKIGFCNDELLQKQVFGRFCEMR